MCETIRVLRIIFFIIVFAMIVFAVLYGAWFCKKRDINMNSFSGMFEMYRRVFMFEDKFFSVLMLGCIYVGGLIVFIIFGATLWAEGQGCVFPTRYSK